MKLLIKCSNETRFDLDDVESEWSIAKLKEAIAAKLGALSNETVQSSSLRLIYSGRVLKDEENVAFYKIGEGHTIHCVRGSATKSAASSAAPSTTASTSTTTTPVSPAQTTQPTQPTQPAPATVPTQNPLLAALGGGGMNPLMGSMGAMGGIGGMGGMGGMGNMPAGANPDMMNQLMQSPAFLSAMSSMMSNPAFMDAIMASNPMLSQMMTPEMRQVMQSDQFRAMMSDPNMLRMMMSMNSMMGGSGMGAAPQNPFLNLFGATSPTAAANTDTTRTTPSTTAPSTSGSTTTTSTNPMANPFGDPMALANLLGPLMGAGGNPLMGAGMQQPQSNVPPEERYAEQLRQLQEMGFYNPQQNLRALQISGGNVEMAIEWLFMQPQ